MIGGVIFICISLALLLYLAYKGWSVIIIAPLLGLLACFGGALCMGEAPHLMAHYTITFMSGAATFIKSYFPIFLLGAIFGKFIEKTGSADAIADFFVQKIGSKYAILTVVIICAVLTYGGVSLFVVSFAMYPIAAKLFRESGINKRILPGTIALGAFTFTMTALPGSPQVQNAVPMKFLGTTAFAAPVLGIVAAAIMFCFGYVWLVRRAKICTKKYGPGYGDWKENLIHIEKEDLPSFGVAIFPIVVCVVANVIFSKIIFPNTNGDYLQQAFEVTLQSVIGTWSLLLALIIAVIVCTLMNWRRVKDTFLEILQEGVMGSFLPIFNTASENGYGTVISSLAAYSLIAGAITAISSNPLVVTAISSSVLAGITGSATGGLTIALTTMGDKLIALANARGIPLEVVHRVACVACGGLDTLPHNGAVITLLAITQMRHKDSYKDIGMNTVVFPLIATAVIIILGSMGVQ